jgi:hypothetical protein
LLLIACALLLGGLAGAAVTHHFEQLSTQSVASHQSNLPPKPPRNQPQNGTVRHPNKQHAKGGPGAPPATQDQPETT